MNQDTERLRRAVTEYESRLLRCALRWTGDPEVARDTVQDTFLRLCAQPPGAVDGHLAEWLFTVCRNRALDHRRKEGRMRTATGASAVGGDSTADSLAAAQAPPHEADPYLQSERRDTAARALRLLGLLPANQQEVLRLKFQEGLSYKEIAGVTELTVSHVGVLIHHGLKSLRERMDVAARTAPQGLKEAP